MKIHHLLAISLASLASAKIFSLTVFAPGTNVDGATLDAAAESLFTGIMAPSTYCPVDSIGSACPAVAGTLVYAQMSAMAVMVPGGQSMYVSPDGQVKYTVAHSSYKPQGSFQAGWVNKTVVSECGPTISVVDFFPPDGSTTGGLMLCPNVPDFMGGSGASYQLYAKTSGINQANCQPIVGLILQPNDARFGCWQYT